MHKYSSYILFMLITVFVVILYVNDFGPLAGLQRSVNDFLCEFAANDDVGNDIVIVSIDGVAQDEYGTWPWDYDLVADLLAATATGEPKTIMLDFVLNEDARQDSAGHTDVLAGQLSWIKNVVIPYDIALATFRNNRTNNTPYLFDYSVTVNNPLGIMKEESSLQVRKVFLPAEKILKQKPFLGYDYTMPDEDRVLRHQSLVMNFDGYYYPSLPLLAATIHLDVPPDQVRVTEGEMIELGSERIIPINDASEFFVNYPLEEAFKKYSAVEILKEGFELSKLKNKLVLIEVDDISSNVYFRTPVSDQVPKSLVTAAIVENIVNDNIITVKDDEVMMTMLILFIVGGICAFVLPQVSLLNRFIILFALLVVLANVTYLLFSSFNIIYNTIFIGLELLLFMIASPLLDTELLNAEARDKRQRRVESRRARIPKAEIHGSTDATEDEVRVRQIRESSTDEENIATKAISADDTPPPRRAGVSHGRSDSESLFPEDHQSIDLEGQSEFEDESVPGDSDSLSQMDDAFETMAADSSGPEIIRASEDSSPIEIGSDGDMIDFEDDVPVDEDSSGIALSLAGGKITNLGRYQITGTVGRGAMGHVYKGVDPAINRPVALKTIRLDFVNDPDEMKELKERLHREAQAAGKLSHPNIVTIYDVGSEGHLQYIAMEFLEGRTLEDMIKKKAQFNYRIIAQVIMQICSALEYAHDQGIVHRDIKPANIMVTNDYRVKVMDYGIARIDSNSMTKTGIAMGTPNYISPEQLRALPVDKRADLWSLGVVIYELLLGRRPFRGENITSLIYSILNTEPEKPSNVNPQIPLLFDHIVEKALKKDPNKRYQRARDIMNDMNDFVESFAN